MDIIPWYKKLFKPKPKEVYQPIELKFYLYYSERNDAIWFDMTEFENGNFYEHSENDFEFCEYIGEL